MIRIVVQNDVAEQIRQSDGQIELVDLHGRCVGIVCRPPTEQEIQFAKGRVGSQGPTFTVDELIAKVEAFYSSSSKSSYSISKTSRQSASEKEGAYASNKGP